MADIGFFLSGEELGPNEIIRAAQQAEQQGIERIWLSDHFHPWMSQQDSSPFVWAVLGALAATTQLKMTTAVTCPTTRIHPAIIAQATATIATMAEGRFTFGVGSGEALNEHILGDTWPPVSVRQEKLEESLEIIRALWQGDIVTHEGLHYTVHNARLFVLPETLPEILISGFGPQAVTMAAEQGDGWITVEPDEDGMKTYKDAGGKGRTQGGLKFCWAETEEEAAATAHQQWGHEVGATEGQLITDIPMWFGFEAVQAMSTPEKMADAMACGPDPEKLAANIKAYVDLGFDEVYCSQMGHDQEGGLRFLTEQVIPLL